MPKIRSIIFDMDGTLLDSTELIYRAMEDVLASHGVKITRQEISQVTGKPVKGMYALLAPELDPDELEMAHLAHHAENIHLLKGYDNVHEVLQSLKKKGYRLGVFTGFDKTTYDRLDQFKLTQYFDAIVENTMYTAHKPDPEGLFLCMERLGVNPGQVVYVGDGIADILAGKKAKVAATVGITHGFSTKQVLAEFEPDYIVDSLLEFEQLVDKLEQKTATVVRSSMDHKTVEEYILSMPNARLDYPFGKDVAVYKVSDPSAGSGQGKMFALISEGSKPVRLSLKCDPKLAEVLREKYESVMPGYHLNKKHWNTLVLSGQLPWEEVQGLIRHSYQLVTG